MLDKEELNKSFIEIISTPQTVDTGKEIHEFYNHFSKKYLSSGKEILSQYVDVWQAIPMIKNDYSPAEAFEQFKNHVRCDDKIEQKIVSKNKYKYIALVLAAVIVPILFFIFSNIKNSYPEGSLSYSEYHVPYGSRSKITLPDSSLVWLNAGSTLKYSSDFNVTDRQIQLEGEAFFEVARNQDKPFIVSTENAAVKVLGTSFNLKAYPEENVVETTVSSGIVEVCNKLPTKNKSEKIILKANEKICLKNSSEIKLKETVEKDSDTVNTISPARESTTSIEISRDIDPNVSSSWKEDEWIIESKSLAEFAIMIERRFNVTIHFSDKHIQEYTFSGRLKDENLNQMLEAISKTAPISYKTKNTKVFLSKRKTGID